MPNSLELHGLAHPDCISLSLQYARSTRLKVFLLPWCRTSSSCLCSQQKEGLFPSKGHLHLVIRANLVLSQSSLGSRRVVLVVVLHERNSRLARHRTHLLESRVLLKERQELCFWDVVGQVLEEENAIARQVLVRNHGDHGDTGYATNGRYGCSCRWRLSWVLCVLGVLCHLLLL